MDIIRNQNNARLSEAQQQKVSEALSKVIEENGATPSSFRELVLNFADFILNQESSGAETPENVIRLTPDTYHDLNEFMNRKYGFELNLDYEFDLQKFKTIIYQYFPVEPETVEKEIQVEKPLEENQFIISLDNDQLKIANHIIENRAKKFKELEKDPESMEELFKNCFFDESVLGCYGGGFYTGLDV